MIDGFADFSAADRTPIRIRQDRPQVVAMRRIMLEDSKNRCEVRQRERVQFCEKELDDLKVAGEFGEVVWLEVYEAYLAKAVEFYRGYTKDPAPINQHNLEAFQEMLEENGRRLDQARDRQERQRQWRKTCKGLWFSPVMRCPDCNRFMELTFHRCKPAVFSCRCHEAEQIAYYRQFGEMGRMMLESKGIILA